MICLLLWQFHQIFKRFKFELIFQQQINVNTLHFFISQINIAVLIHLHIIHIWYDYEYSIISKIINMKLSYGAPCCTSVTSLWVQHNSSENTACDHIRQGLRSHADENEAARLHGVLIGTRGNYV